MNKMHFMAIQLLMLAVFTAIAESNRSNQTRVSCRILRPMQDLNLSKQVRGSWLKLETAVFSYGVPRHPQPSALHRSELSCHRLDVFTVSPKRLKGAQYFYDSGSLSPNDVLSGKFTLKTTRQQPARWNIVRPSQDTAGVELLVLSLDPTSRLAVLAVCMTVAQLDAAACCSPLANVLDRQHRPRSHESESFLTSVSLLSPISRIPQPHELNVARDQIRRLLGGNELYFPLTLGTFCKDL